MIGVSFNLQFSRTKMNVDLCKVVPWGRFMNMRKDLVQASKPRAEGGTGIAQAFWKWNEEQIKSYL